MICSISLASHRVTSYQSLQVLDLSENTLTGCLFSFLPDPHPGLLQLEKLYFHRTELNKDDVHHLLSITYKLPKLQELNLSGYTLTGCLSHFLPDPHPGLPQLEKLQLWSTELNTIDLTHLTHLIQTRKLPALKFLNLVCNSLYEMEMEVEHLIEACVNHHQRELRLRLWGNYLSDAFVEKLMQRFAETNIISSF